jgi:hypothetical protein
LQWLTVLFFPFNAPTANYRPSHEKAFANAFLAFVKRSPQASNLQIQWKRGGKTAYKFEQGRMPVLYYAFLANGIHAFCNTPAFVRGVPFRLWLRGAAIAGRAGCKKLRGLFGGELPKPVRGLPTLSRMRFCQLP